MSEKDKKQLTRRDALKVLGAAAGATALANLPNKWDSPELLSGVLPAHAQTSACGDYMQAIAVTTTMVESEFGMEYGDFDFILCTPNGYFVWGGRSGDGATSGPDNRDLFGPNTDSEWLEIAGAVEGTYSIYLINWSDSSLDISIQITTATGVQTIDLTLTADRAVADVIFPCGEVTLRSEEVWAPCAPRFDALQFDAFTSKYQGK